MKETVTFTIPDGHKTVEFEEEIDVSKVDFLKTKRQHRYTSVHRSGDLVSLKRHVVVCPCCYFKVPAYDRHLRKAPIYYTARIPDRVIDAWADLQYSFFDADDNFLFFNEVSAPEGPFECPKCHFLSLPAKQDITISIGATEDTAFITSTRINTSDVFKFLLSSSVGMTKLQFPLSESVEFNLKLGCVIYRVLDTSGEEVIAQDITNTGNNTITPMVFKIMTSNNQTRKNFARAFQWLYNSKLPFATRELSPRNYVEMTRFAHFSREFYDTIPYNLYDGKLDRSFSSVATQLRSIENLPDLYHASGLPNVKSIRRLFFSNPGFFWYIEEAKLLAEIVHDVNILCRLLSLSHIYDIFSFLHQYPGTVVFLKDYVSIKGKTSLLKRMEDHWDAIKEYSRYYSTMSISAKTQEQCNWRNRRVSATPSPQYSVPMQPGFNKIKDHTTVGAYTFSWLRSKSDYIQAGSALHNCLGGRDQNDNPVLVIKKRNQYKAAMEIKNGFVVQEWAARNTPIELDKDLYEAITEFKQDHNLTNCYLDEDDQENASLWF